MSLLLLLWVAAGVVCHVIGTDFQSRLVSTNLWRDPLTYVMFVPAIILGPLYAALLPLCRDGAGD